MVFACEFKTYIHDFPQGNKSLTTIEFEWGKHEVGSSKGLADLRIFGEQFWRTDILHGCSVIRDIGSVALLLKVKCKIH